MAKLTAKERKWLEKVQAVLDECPSKRIAFYTIGDSNIYAYDVTKYDEISNHLDNDRGGDFCKSVEAIGASFDVDLVFENAVESTAG